MNTAGGEYVEVVLTASLMFGRLKVRLGPAVGTAFLTPAQLRELAEQCRRIAVEIERANDVAGA